jgi:hypothetical protein
LPPPEKTFPLLQKIKDVYRFWFECYQILPKPHRYSLGVKIDTLYIEVIEAMATAMFLPKEQKLSFVLMAIRKTDTIQVILQILWEMKSLDNKKYAVISEKMVTIGKMLGGWRGQLLKQNSPVKTREK